MYDTTDFEIEVNAALEAAAKLPRVEEGARLTMLEYLQALEAHHIRGWFYLVDGRGYHPSVV